MSIPEATKLNKNNSKNSSDEKKSKHATRASEIALKVEIIQDSRGRDTLRVIAELDGTIAMGDVPAGASKGEDEARTVPVAEAKASLEKTLFPMVKNSSTDFRRVDEILELDRTLVYAAGRDFSEIGANAILPLSRAIWQLGAKTKNKTLCDFIKKAFPQTARKNTVHLYMNVFNGGLHVLKDGEELGKDRIDFQEIMIVPVGINSYRDIIQMGDRVDQTLKEILKEKFKAENVSRGDEAGLTVKGMGDSAQAIQLVIEAIERAGYIPGEEIKIALDVAASSFYNEKTGDYKVMNRLFNTDDMVQYLVLIADHFKDKIISIEDGLAENDWQGWEKLTVEMKKRGIETIGDDLFVTQMKRLTRGINNQSATGILIKPNQNGSMVGTLEVIQYAMENNLKCIVSHRSGETLDNSIADLAQAIGALGLKSGDPQPLIDFPDKNTHVRRVKYERLCELQEAGWFN